jgi:hypothetical protein
VNGYGVVSDLFERLQISARAQTLELAFSRKKIAEFYNYRIRGVLSEGIDKSRSSGQTAQRIFPSSTRFQKTLCAAHKQDLQFPRICFAASFGRIKNREVNGAGNKQNEEYLTVNYFLQYCSLPGGDSLVRRLQ